MIAAVIYGTRWGKNRKGKENKTLYGLSRRWAGQGQPRRAPAAASRARKRCSARLLFWICGYCLTEIIDHLAARVTTRGKWSEFIELEGAYSYKATTFYIAMPHNM